MSITFVPEIIEIKEDNLVVKIKLKAKIRKEFCEQVCPFKNECPNFDKIRNEEIVPYRELKIEKRVFKGDSEIVCSVLS